MRFTYSPTHLLTRVLIAWASIALPSQAATTGEPIEHEQQPADPFPFPPGYSVDDLLRQTNEQALAKSASCIGCHQGVGDMHAEPTVRLGCIDCHGGDAQATTMECA